MKKEYFYIIIIGFLFCGCSKTMIWKNYDIVRGYHNTVLSENEDINFNARFKSNLATSNFFRNVYGNSYDYEFYITINYKNVYESIERIKFNELLLLYNETEVDLLNLTDLIIRYPYPGYNNEEIINIFIEKNELPLIIPSEEIEFNDYGHGMDIGLFFNNIVINFDEIDKLIMKFNFEVFRIDGDINEFHFMLFYEKNINKYKIAKWTT